MARKNFLLEESRRLAGENMFVSPDKRSMRRGRRSAPRTRVCRPCLVWCEGDEAGKMQGVLLDLNPYGLKLRMLEELEDNTAIVVQMMRDDEFTIPLSRPIHGKVVRRETGFSGFIDHGIKVTVETIKRAQPPRFSRPEPARPYRRRKTRMHTIDFRVGGNETGRRK